MDLILQKLKLIHIKDLNIHDPGFLEIAFLSTMSIRVVEFSSGGGIKLRIFLPRNQHTQRKFLNIENWTLAKTRGDYFDFSCKKIK